MRAQQLSDVRAGTTAHALGGQRTGGSPGRVSPRAGGKVYLGDWAAGLEKVTGLMSKPKAFWIPGPGFGDCGIAFTVGGNCDRLDPQCICYHLQKFLAGLELETITLLQPPESWGY